MLVVEDEPALRISLADYMVAHGFAVDQASTCEECLAFITRARPDLVLLDLALPDGSGLAVAAQVRQRHGLSVGIIMLTAYGDEQHRLSGLGVGADVYLVKDTSLREIEAYSRNLLRRLQPASAPSTINDPPVALWQLDETHWQLMTPDGAAVPLTGSEVAFLKPLMATPHAVLQRKQLSLNGNPRTLDTVVLRLRRKIEAATSHPPPFKMVYGAGYVFIGAPATPS